MNPEFDRLGIEKKIKTYFKDSSLLEDLDELKDPKKKVDENNIANFLLKYFYCYYKPEYVDQKISPEEITVRLQTYHSGFYRKLNNCKDVIFHENHGYQLEMLVDFPKTMSLFKHIITKNVETEFINKSNLIGIDAGSGTGILVCAQDILASRNKLSTETSFLGIEISKWPYQTTQNLLSKLNKNIKIINNSITNPSVYKEFKNKIPFIFSSENITSTYQELIREDYLLAQYVFQESFPQNLNKVLFFPQGLEIMLNPNKTVNITNPIDFRQLLSDSDDYLKKQKKFNKYQKQIIKLKHLHINHGHPTHILFDKELNRLEEIGTKYRELFYTETNKPFLEVSRW